MKKLVTMIALTATGVAMVAAPVAEVSATTDSAKTTQVNNQFSEAQSKSFKSALNRSATIYLDSSGIYQVKIVDKEYLANYLKNANLNLTIEEVQSEVDKSNKIAQNDPEDFSYKNPLLRKKKNKKLCKTAIGFAGDFLGAAFTIGGIAAGAPQAGAIFGSVYSGLMNKTRDYIC